MDKRKTAITVLGVVLVVALAAWWYSGFSLDFMRFFAAEPSPTPTPTATLSQTPTPTTSTILVPAVVNPPIPAVVTLRCAPETQAVAVGVSAKLTATGGGGTYQWYAPDASPMTVDATTGTAQSAVFVTYPTTGVKRVLVQSGRGDGTDNTDVVSCAVTVQ